MTDTAKLKAAIDQIANMRSMLLSAVGDVFKSSLIAHYETSLECMRLVLAAQIAESAVEAVADAINRARYHSPIAPNLRERGLADEDASSKEYAFRLARAALAAASLSGSVERGVTEEMRWALEPFAKLLKGNYSHQSDDTELDLGFGKNDLRFKLKIGDFRRATAALSPGSAPQVRDAFAEDVSVSDEQADRSIRNSTSRQPPPSEAELHAILAASLPPSGAQVTRDELSTLLREHGEFGTSATSERARSEACADRILALFGRRA